MKRHLFAVCLAGLAMALLFGARRVDVVESRAEEQPSVGPPLLELEPSYYGPHGTEIATLEIETRYDEARQTAAPPQHVAAVPVALTVTSRRGEVSPHNGVALTFDTEIPNGIEAQQTLRRVLDTLSASHVHATFFVVGRWARANPGLLRRIVADGHEVANHSFTHAPFFRRSSMELRAELHGVERVVRRDTEGSVAALFRPPYGCIDAAAARLVRREGYRLIGWNISGRDASNHTGSPAEVIAAVRRNLHAGGTILLHTNRWITAGALPGILQLLARQGLRPMTVSDLLRQQPLVAARLSRAAERPCRTEPPRLLTIAHHRAAP